MTITMKVVDPHIHLWDTTKENWSWLTNPGEAYSGDNRLLPKCHDAAAWLDSTQGVNVTMSVNVEANPTDSVAEAQWLQSLADNPVNHGHPHGIVACADLSQPNVSVLLEQLSGVRNLRGIRQILNVHVDPRYNYVNKHYLRDAQWQRGLQQLRKYDWSFDLQIYPSQVPDAISAINAHPTTQFIVNHAGMFVDRNDVTGWHAWRTGLQALASCPNVAIKISGLAMFDHHWTTESLRPYVLAAIDSFGHERCMFASNFPIDGLHGSYQSLWSAYAEIVSGASVSERDNLFANNAVRYYRLQR